MCIRDRIYTACGKFWATQAWPWCRNTCTLHSKKQRKGSRISALWTESAERQHKKAPDSVKTVWCFLVRPREFESRTPWLKEPTGQNTLTLEVSSFRYFCAKHRDFPPGNFCTLCRILQVRVPIASLETVQKQCRNRALTLGQIKNDDFWSMTWWRFEWPQR